MVNCFLKELIPFDFLPRLNVLVTSIRDGVQVSSPQNHSELVGALVKTTWIPFVTGSTLHKEQFLDGGYSRVLHPPCNYSVWVPTTFDVTIHTLNPGFGRSKVDEFFEMGRSAKGKLWTVNSELMPGPERSVNNLESKDSNQKADKRTISMFYNSRKVTREKVLDSAVVFLPLRGHATSRLHQWLPEREVQILSILEKDPPPVTFRRESLSFSTSRSGELFIKPAIIDL